MRYMIAACLNEAAFANNACQNLAVFPFGVRKMKIYPATAVLLSSMLLMAPSFASETCSQLPDALQTIAVNHISQNSELNSLDDKLDQYIKPCLATVTEQNKKAICANGRLAAEQALRVIARIDQAGSRNTFLANAKVKSYKNALALLDHTKKLRANRTCS